MLCRTATPWGSEMKNLLQQMGGAYGIAVQHPSYTRPLQKP